jgi:hypothetical protein
MKVMKPNGRRYSDHILAQPNLHHNFRAEVIIFVAEFNLRVSSPRGSLYLRGCFFFCLLVVPLGIILGFWNTADNIEGQAKVSETARLGLILALHGLLSPYHNFCISEYLAYNAPRSWER